MKSCITRIKIHKKFYGRNRNIEKLKIKNLIAGNKLEQTIFFYLIKLL